MGTLPAGDDNSRPTGHAWWPHADYANGCHVWRCTCNETVYQMFGDPVPCELISHPQEFGLMRGGELARQPKWSAR